MSMLSIVVAVLSGCLGAFCCVVIPRSILYDRRLRREGVVVSGRVGERVTLPDGDQHRVHFEADGAPHSTVPSTWNDLETGQIVRVRYLPGRPHEARLDQPNELKNDTRGFIAGAVLGWVGVAVAVVLGLAGVF